MFNGKPFYPINDPDYLVACIFANRIDNGEIVLAMAQKFHREQAEKLNSMTDVLTAIHNEHGLFQFGQYPDDHPVEYPSGRDTTWITDLKMIGLEQEIIPVHFYFGDKKEMYNFYLGHKHGAQIAPDLKEMLLS